MKQPLIAIIGRPNVGKSTLFNRLLNQRHSIVDPEEGITRDRIYGEVEWCGQALKFIDTGGYISNDNDYFNEAIRMQAEDAIDEADLVLFIVDGKQGVMPNDKILARLIRERNRPYLIVVNKCDGYKTDHFINQFYELGFDNLIPISALNGRLTGNLLDEILNKLDILDIQKLNKLKDSIRLTIVGMPNVGKSTLTNALLKRERSIVNPIAGTTRDAIDANLKWYGHEITLVDTAGLRKLAKLKDRVEYYSSIRAKRAIDKSNIVLMVIDAIKGFNRQDKNIVDEVINKGKGLVFIVNKWDLIEKKTDTVQLFQKEIRRKFKALDHYPIIFISALTKQRIHRVLEIAIQVYKRSRFLIPTKKLNDAIVDILSKNPPQASNGKQIQIKYGTQVSFEPTVIALYSNYPNKIQINYRRFLDNQFRKKFDLEGVPIFLSFRHK